MTGNNAISSDDIEKAAESLRNLRPAYESLLDFYARVFIIQEKAKKDIRIDAERIPKDIFKVKMKEGFPLVQSSDFVFDKVVSNRLLKEICRIASNTNETLAASAHQILTTVNTGRIDPDFLFENLLNENDIYFEHTAKKIHVEKKMLAFFVYSSLKPSLQVFSEALFTDNLSNHAWEKGYCPVCGNPPVLASIEGEGQKYLFCSFCWKKWRVERIFCPFCETKDQKALKYFYSDDEPEYRVSTCDHCQKYIKSVDVRKLDRIFYPPLEQIATLHLDLKAAEMGLQAPVLRHIEF